MGLTVVGDFLISYSGQDLVSGIAIDQTPSSTYLWTFMSPLFDGYSFLHMSLGDRVVECTHVEQINDAIDVYKKKLGGIETACDLVRYIDENKIEGDYAYWARLVSLIRSGNLGKAEGAASDFKNQLKSPFIDKKFSQMEIVRAQDGWGGVQMLLKKWECETRASLGIKYLADPI